MKYLRILALPAFYLSVFIVSAMFPPYLFERFNSNAPVLATAQEAAPIPDCYLPPLSTQQCAHVSNIAKNMIDGEYTKSADIVNSFVDALAPNSQVKGVHDCKITPFVGNECLRISWAMNEAGSSRSVGEIFESLVSQALSFDQHSKVELSPVAQTHTTNACSSQADVNIVSRWQSKNKGIAYICITSFRSESTSDDFRFAILDLQEEQDIEGLIFDLRFNGGGNIKNILPLVGMLTGPQLSHVYTIMYYSGRSEKKFHQETHDELLGAPIVTLVGKNSGSTTEVILAALQESGRVELWGETTYGKSSVQFLRESGDVKFRVSEAEIRAPSGAKIHEIGIAPDVAVDFATVKIPDIFLSIVDTLVSM